MVSLRKMAVTVTYLYRVGDRVKLRLGAHDVVATVIEDRGLLGPGGQQLVRVSVPVEANDNTEFEVSASMVEPIQGRARL